jgi:peptidoglycan/xylan/chitin deacetylase (PgdA/CDA1 family)
MRALLALPWAACLSCHAAGAAPSTGAASPAIAAPAATSAPSSAASSHAASTPAARAPIPVAVTFDDLPAHGPTLPGQSYLDIHQKLLDTLAAHHVPQVYGFINGARLETQPDGRRVLELWRDAGFPLGNHTWAHEDIGKVGVAAAIRDIDRNDQLLAELMGDSAEARAQRRVFRYPFLHQGRDMATLDGVRAHLRNQGYRIAEVTIDFGDWAYNGAFVRCTAAGAEPAIEALRWNYEHRGLEYLEWAEAAARVIWGRPIRHILLLHSGSFDAVMLDRLLTSYEQRGVRWISLDDALADPIYAEDVRVPSPAQGTLIEQRIERDAPATPPYHIQSEGLLRHVCAHAPRP